MPVEEHEVHLLEWPPVDPAAPPEKPLVKGGQGRSAEDLVEDAFRTGILIVLFWACLLGMALIRAWTR